MNNSDSGVYIKVIRDMENLPAGWATSICIDICLSPDIDTTSFYLPAGTTQSYTMYFYTDPTPGFGNVRMRFGNMQVPSNRFTKSFYCMTDSSITNINNNTISEPEYKLNQNYPNPFNPDTKISFVNANPGM
ncbi:MAG: hypothetical protein IPM38_06740 [Ignavibacteria bacterium]|nr:hypothetical protein [Ignavibacteria bacterium]